MATASIRLSGTIDGLGIGSQPISPVPNTYAAANGTRQFVNLASGNNTITVPSGAHAVCIIPPSGNAVTIQLKGVNADTGVALAVNQWTWISFSEASPPATFVLTAGATLNGVELNWV